MTHKSSSKEQQDAEIYIREQLSHTIGVNLDPRSFPLGDQAFGEFDGLDEQNRCVCEIYARIGDLKPAQRKKIAADILKMYVLERTSGEEWRKVLCVADEDTRDYLFGNSWLAAAVRELRIEVHVVSLNESLKHSVINAQTRQER